MTKEITYDKSTRHSIIIGNSGERIVSNWLSRKKFEVAIVDHTGIDIIAQNPNTKRRLGITVKSRARNTEEGESDPVNLFEVKSNDWKKTNDACSAFGCVPWVAVYVETKTQADLFLTPLTNYKKKYCNKGAKSHYTWKMTKKWLSKYEEDEKVNHIHLTFQEKRWF
jgi:hypothetical protein